MDALQIANSLPMWIACGLAVGLVVVQAAIFAKNAWAAGKKMGITEKQMKKAQREQPLRPC